MRRVATGCLWWLYGFTYDGLRHFMPYRTLLNLVVAQLPPRSGLKILELGSGTGNLLEVANAANATASFVGVDSSASMVRVARHKLAGHQNVSIVHEDILDFLTQQPDRTFDVAVSMNVIYALRDRERVWGELRRVLTPDGMLVVATPTTTRTRHIISEHLAASPFHTLLRPRLIGVFLTDFVINRLGDSGALPFPEETLLRKELMVESFSMGPTVRCYGGADILFTAVRTE